MQSDASLNRLKQFPRLMWVVLLGSFFTRGSYYMVWPFLAVILYQKFALSATEVGLILTNAALVSVVVSFLGSALSDRIGRRKLIYFSGILYIVSFCLLAKADTILSYAIVITLCSIATSLWRPLISALIGDIIEQPQTRELAMQALYFIINAGCAIGPIIGVWLGITAKQEGFYITAVAFALLLFFLHWGFKTQPILEAKKNTNHREPCESALQNSTIKTTMTVLLQDRLLQCLILANILCMFIYAQMDTSLVQYLSRAKVPELLTLISSMIFTNALVIISSQFVLLRLMSKMTLTNRIQIGLILLFISQLWLAFNPLTWFWGFIGAIVVMSLAEAILFPTMNVHIDRIAPNHLRGAYFGAASFYEFGYALAPLGGGIILDLLSGTWLFSIVAALTLLVMYLYSILETLSRGQVALE
ncbi:MFS transporter [Thalassotalea aquiviva]|uniref:MFS transporter n=1 Tax=Thalassotalea aquiviva TaxID=3242415 RepID=UPI00352A808D